jgi:hypothetical protein
MGHAMGQGYERGVDIAVEENEPTSGFDGTLSEGFRTEIQLRFIRHMQNR